MNKVGQAKLCRTCAGTVMVELAIILPLLLFLLFGITELGRALYQQNMLTQAVELGGRYMARVNGAVTDDCVGGGRWGDAVAVTKNLIMCGVDGTGGCAKPVLPNITFDDPVASFEVNERSSSSSSSSVSACVITVRVTADFQSIFGDDMVSMPGLDLEALTLNAMTQERYIGR